MTQASSQHLAVLISLEVTAWTQVWGEDSHPSPWAVYDDFVNIITKIYTRELDALQIFKKSQPCVKMHMARLP